MTANSFVQELRVIPSRLFPLPKVHSGVPYYGTCEKEVADEGVEGCCLERRSFVGALRSLCRDSINLADFFEFMCKVNTRQKPKFEVDTCLMGF